MTPSTASMRTPLTLAILAGVLLASAPAAVALEPGDAAPALTLTDVDGRAWSLGELQGKVVHLAFVAVWCEPCRKEAAQLADLGRRHGRQGYVLLLVGVPARQDERRLTAWRAQQGLDGHPLIHDAKGEATRVLGADLLPHHVVIGRKGRVQLVADRLSDRAEARIRTLVRGGAGG